MKYDILFDAFPDYVLIRTKGEAFVQDFDALLTQMTQSPQWQSGTNLFVDHRELESDNLTPDAMQSIVETAEKHKTRLGNGRCAFVVERAVGVGLCRMYELYGGDHIHKKIGIFNSIDDASEWLKK